MAEKLMRTKLYILVLILTATWSCKKDSSSTQTNTQIVNNSCSAIGTPQDTITDSGAKYYMVATSGANNLVNIELINNTTYATNMSINFLQAKNGTNCFESNTITTWIPPQYKDYTFGSFPSWAIDTNTVCILKLTINNNVYYLRDNKLNK